jgi:hypothetical protein
MADKTNLLKNVGQIEDPRPDPKLNINVGRTDLQSPDFKKLEIDAENKKTVMNHVANIPIPDLKYQAPNPYLQKMENLQKIQAQAVNIGGNAGFLASFISGLMIKDVAKTAQEYDTKKVTEKFKYDMTIKNRDAFINGTDKVMGWFKDGTIDVKTAKVYYDHIRRSTGVIGENAPAINFDANFKSKVIEKIEAEKQLIEKRGEVQGGLIEKRGYIQGKLIDKKAINKGIETEKKIAKKEETIVTVAGEKFDNLLTFKKAQKEAEENLAEQKSLDIKKTEKFKGGFATYESPTAIPSEKIEAQRMVNLFKEKEKEAHNKFVKGKKDDEEEKIITLKSGKKVKVKLKGKNK